MIEGGFVAARLIDIGTFRTAFRGVRPTGKPARFAKHVFYRLGSGLTDEV